MRRATRMHSAVVAGVPQRNVAALQNAPVPWTGLAEERGLSLERISGPWQGLYVVSYTTEFDGLYYGYAKLCR